MDRSDIGFLDRDGEVSIVERNLPHWCQPGTLAFITWRLADSLPGAMLEHVNSEINTVLQREGLRAHASWRNHPAVRDHLKRRRVEWKLFATWDKFLDAGYGACLLAKPLHAQCVMRSLRHCDGDRYLPTDAIVIPNHVHLIAAFPSEEAMLKQCEGWKRFTAREINREEGREGELWQVDQFDHLIRSQPQFDYLRHYIHQNASAAGITLDTSAKYQKGLS